MEVTALPTEPQSPHTNTSKLNVRIPHSTVDFVATRAARPEFHQLGPNGGIKFGA